MYRPIKTALQITALTLLGIAVGYTTHIKKTSAQEIFPETIGYYKLTREAYDAVTDFCPGNLPLQLGICSQADGFPGDRKITTDEMAHALDSRFIPPERHNLTMQ